MIARVWRGATRAEDAAFGALDDVRAFAGDDVERAVFYAEDDRWLVERDLRVRHYEVDAVIDPSVPWDSSSGPAR